MVYTDIYAINKEVNNIKNLNTMNKTKQKKIARCDIV